MNITIITILLTADAPVQFSKLEFFKKGNVLHAIVDVTVRSELNDSTQLAISTWASANADGTGWKTGYSKQVSICVF